MATTRDVSRDTFRAAIREIEPGVFRAEYRGELNPENPDARELSDFHVGTSIAGVKVWVEQMARSLGYGRVVWDELPH